MDLIREELGFVEVEILPRELNTNEIIGRKLFLDINKLFNNVHTKGEVKDWSSYTIDLTNYKISFRDMEYIPSIRYTYNLTTNLLNVTFLSECTPLDGRILTKHLQKELYKWQQKKKKLLKQ